MRGENLCGEEKSLAEGKEQRKERKMVRYIRRIYTEEQAGLFVG